MVDDSKSDDTASDSISRRKVLLSTGAAGLTGLAGCGNSSDESEANDGDDNGSNETSDGTNSAGEAVEPVMDSRISWKWAPADTDMNTFGPLGNHSVGTSNIHWWNHTVYRTPNGFYYHYVGEDGVDIDGCEVTATLKDGLKWWDGTEITAEDLKVDDHLRNYWILGEEPTPENGAIQVVDEKTFTYRTASPLNEKVALANLEIVVRAKRDYWKPWLTKFEEATTDDERAEIKKNLFEKKVTLEEFVDEGLGNGLWKPTDWNSQQIVNEKFADHILADKTNIETLRMNNLLEEQKHFQAFKEDQLDFGGGFSSLQNKVQVPENIKPTTKVTPNHGDALKMNQRNKHLNNVHVRRAIAYALSPTKVAKLHQNGWGSPATPITLQTGTTPDEHAKKILGEKWTNKLIQYGGDSQPDKAAAEMQKAEYTKQDGTWTDPDGEQINFDFIAPTNFGRPLLGNAIAQMLSDAGFNSEFNSLERGTFVNRLNKTHDWDLCVFRTGRPNPIVSTIFNFGGGPWSLGSYDAVTNVESQDGCTREVPPIEYTFDEPTLLESDGKVEPKWGQQAQPFQEIPTEPGVEDLNGGSQEFRPIKWAEQMNIAESDQELRELHRNCALWFNYSIPHVHLKTTQSQLWLDKGSYHIADAPRGNVFKNKNPRFLLGLAGYQSKTK